MDPVISAFGCVDVDWLWWMKRRAFFRDEKQHPYILFPEIMI